MPIAINKILLSLSIILLFTLFIGTCADDAAHAHHLAQTNQDLNSPESVYDMDKRRFLPARRFLHEYITDEFNDENEENQSHLNAKRYFLQSKRYFLNSKRNNERREED